VSTTVAADLRDKLDRVERLAQAVIDHVGPERRGDPYSDGSGQAEWDSFPSYPWGMSQEELYFLGGPGHPDQTLARVRADRLILDQWEAASPEHQAVLGWVIGVIWDSYSRL